MRDNSDKQTRSFTTAQTTSQRKRGARDNRPLDNVLPKTTGQDKRWNSLPRKTNPKRGSTIQHNLTLPVINLD